MLMSPGPRTPANPPAPPRPHCGRRCAAGSVPRRLGDLPLTGYRLLRQLLADAVEEELEAVAEPLGGIGGKGRGGELVLDPAHGQLRLPGAASGQLDLGLLVDGVAEHEVERGEDGPAGPFG